MAIIGTPILVMATAAVVTLSLPNMATVELVAEAQLGLEGCSGTSLVGATGSVGNKTREALSR